MFYGISGTRRIRLCQVTDAGIASLNQFSVPFEIDPLVVGICDILVGTMRPDCCKAFLVFLLPVLGVTWIRQQEDHLDLRIFLFRLQNLFCCQKVKAESTTTRKISSSVPDIVLNAKLQAFPKDGDGRFWKVAMTGKTTSREGVYVSLLPLQNSYQTIEILSQLVLSYSFSNISLIHNL